MTNDHKNSGPADDNYDEEESPSSRLGGDTATNDAGEDGTSSDVRKAAIGEKDATD